MTPPWRCVLADALLECDGEIVPDVIGRNILAWAERFDALIKTCSARPQKNCAKSHSRDGKPVPNWKITALPTGGNARFTAGMPAPRARSRCLYR